MKLTDQQVDRLAERIVTAVKEAPKEWSDPVKLYPCSKSQIVMKPHRESHPDLSQREAVVKILREVFDP